MREHNLSRHCLVGRAKRGPLFLSFRVIKSYAHATRFNCVREESVKLYAIVDIFLSTVPRGFTGRLRFVLAISISNFFQNRTHIFSNTRTYVRTADRHYLKFDNGNLLRQVLFSCVKTKFIMCSTKY